MLFSWYLFYTALPSWMIHRPRVWRKPTLKPLIQLIIHKIKQLLSLNQILLCRLRILPPPPLPPHCRLSNPLTMTIYPAFRPLKHSVV